MIYNLGYRFESNRGGAEKFIEEERQKRLQDNRQNLVNVVQKLFPSLVILARRQVGIITEPSILQVVITNLFSANTLEEAVQYLVEVPEAWEKPNL